MDSLRLAHLEADHRLAAGDTGDLLPGIDPAKAVETARRIIATDYHDGCPLCAATVEGEAARLTATILPFRGTTELGRYATRVRIRAGVFAGRAGVVVRIHHQASVLVRLENGLELPFGPSELETIS